MIGLAVGVVAAYAWGAAVGAYLGGIGPIAALLAIADEVRRFLTGVPAIGPLVGGVWAGLVSFVLIAAGAAVASLVGLAPMNRDSGKQRGRRSSKAVERTCGGCCIWERTWRRSATQ